VTPREGGGWHALAKCVLARARQQSRAALREHDWAGEGMPPHQESAAVEPFVIRCETCHARLRVRDERVLGQIHECPRCGSMVQIVAPAVTSPVTAAAASGESMIFPAVKPAEAVPPGEPPVAPPVAPPAAGATWPTMALWVGGGAALFLLGGVVGALVLRGEEEVPNPEVASHPPVAAVATPPEPSDDNKQVAVPAAKIDEPENATEAAAPAEPAVAHPPESKSFEAVAPRVEAPPAPAEVEPPKPARTLTLEPEERTASVGELADLLATPSYEATMEPDEAKTPAEIAAGTAAGVAPRVTNVGDQLALRVAEIELPGMPLASFVEMFSEMAAVPIVLDEVGVSPRTRVTVRARNGTLESLLTKTLAAHGLAWEERDGQLVVVPAK